MRSLFKLTRLIKPYRAQVIGAILTLILITASHLVIPTIIQNVIDVGLAQRDIQVMIQAALIILGIGLLRAFISRFQRYWSEFVAMNTAYDLRNKLYDHIQHLSFTYHDHARTGQLMSRCTEDVRAIQQFLGSGFIELAQITMILIGTMTLMFIANARLTLIILAPMLLLIYITTRFGTKVSDLFYAVDKSLGDLSSRLQENVSGAQVVRAFSREPFEISRFDKFNRELYDARVTVIGEWAKIMPITFFLVSFSTIMILWFGGQMVIAGEITIGQVVAFNSYMLLLALPAQQLIWFVNGAGEAAAGVIRVFEILDHDPIIKNAPSPVAPESFSGQVEFKNVQFTYQDEDEPALTDITFTALPNQTIALIGPTGSGKSTLTNLIPRFYDATEGAVLVDGHNVKDFDLETLRRQVGIVLQTSLLFSASIRDNVAFGRPDASEEEIFAAAKAAQAHDFILSFPEGYDTIVGERGITLSGGQRQRVAIARALLINPRILILDDSTSSVDTETEHLIQQALDNLIKDRTTFVIAQRLSTVRGADLILVLDKGRIIERGQHDELLKLNGLYKEIYDLQLAKQEQFAADMRSLQAGDD